MNSTKQEKCQYIFTKGKNINKKCDKNCDSTFCKTHNKTHNKINEPLKNDTKFFNERKDILNFILLNIKLQCNDLYNLIMSDNDSSNVPDDIRKGWLFESICQILIVLKCIDGLHYTEICGGTIDNFTKINNIRSLLNIKIAGGGGNIADIIIKQKNTITPFSIKYKKNYCETDLSKIDNTCKEHLKLNYKIGLIVKDKEIFIEHKYKNKKNIDNIILTKLIKNKLLFDEKDIIKALNTFQQRFLDNKLDIDDFIDFINDEYLSFPRKQLTKKLHQKMTELKFIESFNKKNKNTKWCIAHKPRSGKSILILSICKYLLLEKGYKKILIMTSVPATIDSFINDLDTWIDFKNINYIKQENFDEIDEHFSGIVFCSVQYLKTDKNKDKKKQLKKIGFEAIIIDEAHLGSSTNKTKKEILDVDSDIEDIEDICKNIKINIFASGTSDKTIEYYRIPESNVYEWEIEDEAFMKKIIIKEEEEIIKYMSNRHGRFFKECLENETLNKDYSKCPIQVFMNHSIKQSIIDDINNHNTKNGTNFGYDCNSLFALKQTINKEKKVEYDKEFEICKTVDGTKMLKDFFECIISGDKNKETKMKQIEKTQSTYGSRHSTIENPLLFIVYVPIHTGNSTIDLLQETLKKFLEDNDLWSDYNIEYSNSKKDSTDCKEKSYIETIETYMKNTKDNNKKGCILLLGNKGGVGITYHHCDITISLDNGHSLDNQKQRFSRALTETDKKTLGINVDMNIQRTYLYLFNIIQKYRKNTKTEKTNAEILYHLFEHEIFIFNPQEINNGKLKTIEIKSYYKKVAEDIMKEIDETYLLENIICDDDMRGIIKLDFQKMKKSVIKDLEGENLDCKKAGRKHTEIDPPDDEKLKEDDENFKDDEKLKKDENEDDENFKEDEKENLINQTFELCKQYLLPLLALISKSYKIHDFKEIFKNEKTEKIIKDLLINKIELNNYNKIINIMDIIIDKNEEIINTLREIYYQAKPEKLRDLIAKHFIPTQEEKKGNAEIPTPVKLVDEMLDKIPLEFWKSPHKVFEPCCGKGNFVLGIFDRFYIGLEEMYPNKDERCRVIMTDCIYYADLSALNVFITTEILKCHIEFIPSFDGNNRLLFDCDYDDLFNKDVGNTLELDIMEKWKLEGFDAVIGNPPYNKSKDGTLKGGYGGRSLWDLFVVKSLNIFVKENGYLVFIHPPSWRKPEHYLWKVLGKKQLLYLKTYSKKEGNKIFGCSTLVDYYVLKNTNIYKETIIDGQDGKSYSINLNDWNFLPSGSFDNIRQILGKNEVLYSRTIYGTDKKNITKLKTEKNYLPVVHNMTKKDGLGFVYSSEDKGHFGVSKVILSFGEFQYPYNDWNGEYGMSQICYGLKINSKEEGDKIVEAINSVKFKEILKYTKWSTFQTDWRMFKEFKNDFWKYFI